MATTTTITSSFVGKDAGMYIAAAMKESKTLDNLTIMDNVKYKAVVKSLVGSGFIQDESCDFTATGDLNLSEKIITPKALKLNIQLCKQDLLSAWESNQMGAGANNRNTPEFHAFVMSYLADAIAESTENNVWSGADAVGGEFEGFLTATTGAFATDGNVINVTKTASLDADTIVANLSLLADAIPSTVLGKEDLVIFINQKHYRNYIHAMSVLGYIDRFNMSADYTPVFEGIKLVVVDGMPNDKLVAARKSNLFFGCDLVGDQSELRMLDMSDIDGSDNIRVICKYTAGTQIGIGSEIAYLS
tara:strand:+ start:122 stop:1030 length:909 start_codon:yes stop_codon:yes gene_type:complete